MRTFFTVMIYLAGIFYILMGIAFWGWPATLGGFAILALGGIYEILREIRVALIANAAPGFQSRSAD